MAPPYRRDGGNKAKRFGCVSQQILRTYWFWGVSINATKGGLGKSSQFMATAKGTMIIHESPQPNEAHIYNFFDSKLVVANNNLYCLSSKDNSLLMVRLSTDSDTRSSPVQSISTFDDEASLGKLQTRSEETKGHSVSNSSTKDATGRRMYNTTITQYALSNSSTKDPLSIVSPPVPGGLRVNVRRVVVCNDAFYVEHERTLFKWRLGDPEWTNTGLTDRGPSFKDDFRMEPKLAVSGRNRLRRETRWKTVSVV